MDINVLDKYCDGFFPEDCWQCPSIRRCPYPMEEDQVEEARE